MINPLISVIIPVFNGESFLASAIDSVLRQTFENFELIIIDDGSSDRSWEIISSYSDNRILCFRQENLGVVSTLNKAISISKGKYISRLDQDDLMTSDRLSIQLNFLKNHPEYAAVGTAAKIISDHDLTGRVMNHPTSFAAISLSLYFDNPFVHSSMLVNKSRLLDVGSYNESDGRTPPEDFELWSKLATKYQVANIPSFLTYYRETRDSWSRSYIDKYKRKVVKISCNNIFSSIGYKYSRSECYSLACLYHAIDRDGKINLVTIVNMLSDLLKTICIKGYIERNEVKKVSLKIKTKIYVYYFFGFSPTRFKKYISRIFK